MRTIILSVPYKGQEYDVNVAIEQQAEQCRIKAQVGGQEILFVSSDNVCRHAVYRENIIAEGLMDEIGKKICEECLEGVTPQA